LGTVFKLAPDGKLKVLHAFAGGSDGASPRGALIVDKKGRFFGITGGGGPDDYGTVFRLKE
jgi:hypothetical protein